MLDIASYVKEIDDSSKQHKTMYNRAFQDVTKKFLYYLKTIEKKVENVTKHYTA